VTTVCQDNATNKSRAPIRFTPPPGNHPVNDDDLGGETASTEL
jgi:hypothetical protein